MCSFQIATPKGQVLVSVNDSFADLFRLYACVTEPQTTARIFDPAYHALDGGFWIEGIEIPSGRLVHVQALGVIDLAEQTLRDYLNDNARLYEPRDLNLRTSLSSFESYGATQIGGRTCYHGDLWVLGGRAGYQGTRLAQKLTRFAVHLAAQMYGLDSIWALVAEKKVRTGYPLRSGYRNAAPQGAVWIGTDGRVHLEEWIVWSNQRDLLRLELEERDVDVLRGLTQYGENFTTVRQAEWADQAFIS